MLIMLAIVIFLTWTAWNDGHLGWPHIIGLAASVLVLILIWFLPGIRQPTQPPL
jgi:hypothetical protein